MVCPCGSISWSFWGCLGLSEAALVLGCIGVILGLFWSNVVGKTVVQWVSSQWGSVQRGGLCRVPL